MHKNDSKLESSKRNELIHVFDFKVYSQKILDSFLSRTNLEEGMNLYEKSSY